MTNQTIPPCPACGVVPELVEFERPIWVYCCGNNPIHYSVPEWSAKCTTALGRACRELGIETVEQLKARLATDPRVAVLDRLGLLTLDQIEAVLVCAKAAVRASKTEGGIIITEDVTAVIDSIIAAQRGEVEK